MSRGGSRWGGDRGSDFAQAGPDGWANAGGSGPPRPPKAGDLMNFGKIAKPAAMTFGPRSVFAGKKDVKGESLSISNMFLMLSQNPEVPVDEIKPSTQSHSQAHQNHSGSFCLDRNLL